MITVTNEIYLSLYIKWDLKNFDNFKQLLTFTNKQSTTKHAIRRGYNYLNI